LKAAGLRDVVLLNVISPDHGRLEQGVEGEPLEKLQAANRRKLDGMRMALEGQGFSVRCGIEVGHPAVEIVRVAQEERVQLIVMGAQGKSLVQEFLVGSVAWEVVRHAPVPVMVEKFAVIWESGEIRCGSVCAELFKVVLLPTDFSDCANAAFHVVKGWKSAGTEQVILLHIQDERAMQYRPQWQKDEFDREDTKRLDQMQEALTLGGLSSKVLLRTGNPVGETLAVAEEENANLIVSGIRGRTLSAFVLAGSTFENVMRQSRRPVLAIR
jgi:nucleotide-binding universal stress UspA family protein